MDYEAILTEKDMAEIKAMASHELRAAAKIVWYQLNAPIFVGDRRQRLAVFDALIAENKKRGDIVPMPRLMSGVRARAEAGA